jgi:hypothetical protein
VWAGSFSERAHFPQKVFFLEKYWFSETRFFAPPSEPARLLTPGSLRDALFDPRYHGIKPLTGEDIREGKGKITSHAACVSIHHGKIRANMRRQIHLVDHQEI